MYLKVVRLIAIGSLCLSLKATNAPIVQDWVSGYVEEQEESKLLTHESKAYDAVQKIKVGKPSQLISGRPLKNLSDFNAEIASIWTDKAIYIRIKVIDDFRRVSKIMSPEVATGDFFQLSFNPVTTSPATQQANFTINLFPSISREKCYVKIQANDNTKAKLGKILVRLRKPSKDKKDPYYIFLRIPTDAWAKKPAVSQMMKVRAVFNDSDTAQGITHQLIAFGRNFTPNGIAYGNLSFTKRSWATHRPALAKNDSLKVDMNVQSGNNSKFSDDIVFSVYDENNKPIIDNLYTHELAGKSKSKTVKLNLDFSQLEFNKKYRLLVRSGGYFNPRVQSFKILGSIEKPVLIFADYIRPDSSFRQRPLGIVQSDYNRQQEVLNQIVGESEIIWVVGQMDGSSREFKQKIRQEGPLRLNLQKTKVLDLPNTLYGGADPFDGMNEPIILELDEEIFRKGFPLKPEVPDYLSLTLKEKEYYNNATRLMVIGCLMTPYHSNDEATFQVRNQKDEILKTEIFKAPHSNFQAPNLYIIQVWLSGETTEVKLENISENGPAIHLDFMALLRGEDAYKAERVSELKREAKYHFSSTQGQGEAFTKIINNNLYWLRNFNMDTQGVVHPSMPGGRYHSIKLYDMASALNELTASGYLVDAEKIQKRLSNITPFLDSNEFNTMHVGIPYTILALHNFWRKKGSAGSILDANWYPNIEGQLKHIDRNISNNPFQLVSGYGEFGTQSNVGGTSIGLSYTTILAYEAAANIAKSRGQSAKEQAWRKTAHGMKNHFKTHLVSPAGGVRVKTANEYPESYGIPPQNGLEAFIPAGVWLYGRSATKAPILYNEKIRSFDTPHLLFPLQAHIDFYGNKLDQEYKNSLRRTMRFIEERGAACQNELYKSEGIMTFKSTENQLWLSQAHLLTDFIEKADQSINSFVKYTNDSLLPIQSSADAEFSGFSVQESWHVGQEGKIQGGMGDEASTRTILSTLKTARLMVGISDLNEQELSIIPRLPSTWNKLQVDNLLVSHKFVEGRDGYVSMSYERLPQGYNLYFKSIHLPGKVKFRIGPFPEKIKSVNVSINGTPKVVIPRHSGDHFWAWLEVTGEREVNINATPNF
ncbi:MAG: hypothetical protein MK193_01180 [Lentisphaeria bacterium]|nr:hypothetical protein [Lentisphaeria bacterium]